MSKKYIVSCDIATEYPSIYTFVYDNISIYDWFDVKLDKNISRKKKIERILKDYSIE